MVAYLVLVLDSLGVQFSVVLSSEVEIMVAEEGEDRLMEQTQSSLGLCLEEDHQAAIVEGREDKLLVRISQEQGSLD